MIQYTIHYAKPGKGESSEDKTHWPQIGRAFEDDSRITLKLDSLPLPHLWDGRLFLYLIKS